MFKSKKAISPLVATIILLAFAVALGSVVMSWGKGLIEKAAAPEKPEIIEESCDIIQKCFDGRCITQSEYDQVNSLICPS